MQYGMWRISWLIGVVAFGILGGLLWARYFGPNEAVQLFVVSAITAPLLLKRKLLSILPCLFLGVAIGLWRGDAVVSSLNAYAVLQDQEIVVTGSVQTDPVYSDTGQLEFYLANVRGESGEVLPGRVRVRTYNAQAARGDTVAVSGKMRDGFASWQGALYYAKVEVLQKDKGNVSVVRQKFLATIYSNLPDPEASLGLGFLIGVRTLLPEELSRQLSQTGLTHIVAVSGYNLTILVLCARRLLGRFSKFNALAGSLGLLALFLAITGSSPSIVRASVVSLLSLLAWYYGRSVNAVLLLLLSAAVTAFANPFYVWGDVGWYLSFLAFWGVLVLAPPVTKLFYSKKEPGIFGQVFIETSMAQLMTLPLIMLVFGEISVISLVANMLVLPLIPLAMLLTALSGLAVLKIGILSLVFVWPTKLLLTFITSMIQLFSNMPGALQLVTLNVAQLSIWYGMLFALWLFVLKVIKRRSELSAKSGILSL